mmetsp:Transcript_12305/g.18884  ORF Transcript_12305/g.18884 Transcript_12305/m.18884 type:complete len:546 (-) Transcript_12305:75-1712(-)
MISIPNVTRIILFHLLVSTIIVTAFSPVWSSAGKDAGAKLRMATSSKELKNQDRRKHSPSPQDLSLQNRTSSSKTVADIRLALNSLPRTPEAKVKPFDEIRNDDTVGGLSQLTLAIDQRLKGKNRGSSDFAVDFTQKNREGAMSGLLGYNAIENDEKTSILSREILVVFGKPLIDDQVTVEYASRIRELALTLAGKNDNFPDLVCFCGCVRKGNHISDADAGYMFFKYLCLNEGISLQNVKIFVDRNSQSERKALQNVVKHLVEEHVSEWLAVSHHSESPKDEYGLERKALRKKIKLHFTLISSDYHLCNINDIHHRSPNQSLLRSIEMLRTNDRSQQGIMTEYDDELSEFQHGRRKRQKTNNIVNGIIDCSWSYRYASYPYAYSRDDASSFMGKCFLLCENLRPFFVNIKGVVAEREFLQRDNFLAAASIRHNLISLMEDLYKTSPSLQTGLREINTYTDSKETVDIVLEGATLSLGRCIDLVRPAGLHKSSVSKISFIKALRSLEHCMTQIRTFCDPDRPLDPKEWGQLYPIIDEEEETGEAT